MGIFISSPCRPGDRRAGRHCERATEGFWGRIPIRGSAVELANEAAPIWAQTPITRVQITTSGIPVRFLPLHRIALPLLMGMYSFSFLAPLYPPRPFGYWGQTPILLRRKAPYPAGQPKAGRIWALTPKTKGRGESGAKMKTNRSESTPTT